MQMCLWFCGTFKPRSKLLQFGFLSSIALGPALGRFPCQARPLLGVLDRAGRCFLSGCFLCGCYNSLEPGLFGFGVVVRLAAWRGIVLPTLGLALGLGGSQPFGTIMNSRLVAIRKLAIGPVNQGAYIACDPSRQLAQLVKQLAAQGIVRIAS